MGGTGCPRLKMCGFQTSLLPVWRAPAPCMVESHLPGTQSHTLATYTSSYHYPAGSAPWPCALTSDSHPDFCSWREPLPGLPWLRILMSPCPQRLFRTESLLLGSCAHLPDSIFAAPDTNSGALGSRIVTICLVAEGCCSLLGVLQNWQCAWSRVNHFSVSVHWGRTGRDKKEPSGK